MFIRVCATIFVTLSLSACATGYKQPSTDEEFASITFEKGYKDGSGIGRSSTQDYSILREKGCHQPELLTSLHWATSKQKTLRIEAGNQIVIGATNTNYWVDRMELTASGIQPKMANVICQSRLTFTPKVGKKYHIKLIEKTATNCMLEFKDVETSLIPEGALVEDTFTCEM